jgi:hypothetical protein
VVAGDERGPGDHLERAVTTMPVADTRVWQRLSELRDCLSASIALHGGPEPCECAIIPGTHVATEYCGACSGDRCGMAWVRLNSVFPSTVFPTQDVSATGCTPMLAFEVELGVVRCAPIGDDYGNPPKAEEWEAAAQLQVLDMMAMREAVECCFGAFETMLGAFTPIGPTGGCVGGSWAVAVAPGYYGGAPAFL